MRKDGGIYANAKVNSPGVVVSFDSVHGPLRYACDTFDDDRNWRRMPGWQANVRAIALGLEALRRVSRYGIGSRGEAYTGWAQLPAAPGPKMTINDACLFMLRFARSPDEFGRNDLRRTDVRSVLYRRAAAQLHPDRNGDADEFRRLTAAHSLLKDAYG
jgi:hypothetical protein